MKYNNTIVFLLRGADIDFVVKTIEVIIGEEVADKLPGRRCYWSAGGGTFDVKPNWYEDEDGGGPCYPDHPNHSVVVAVLDLSNPVAMKQALLEAFAAQGIDAVIDFEQLISPIPATRHRSRPRRARVRLRTARLPDRASDDGVRLTAQVSPSYLARA